MKFLYEFLPFLIIAFAIFELVQAQDQSGSLICFTFSHFCIPMQIEEPLLKVVYFDHEQDSSA